MRISIFLSYCHDDLKVDERRLKVFIDALQVAGNGVYEIFADYQHPDAGVGSLLPEYMEKINASEAVIILLTPTYKKRIEQKQKTGVYTEFNYIYDKYLEAREKNKYGSRFILMPILYSGTTEDSCPREILDIIAGDIRWLFVSPSDRANSVRRDIRTRLKEFLKKIAGQIAAISETKKSDYPKRAEELFRKFLFDDTKSGWDKVENHRFLESAIVKTSTFMKVRERKFSIIIGRKGSGKSTITHILPILTEPRPIDVLSLDFEQLPFDMCYNILRTNPAQASDIRHAFSPIYSYQLLWDVFLHLYFTWVALDKLSNRSKLSQTVKKLLKGVFTGNETYFEKRQIATKILFVYAFENLIGFIKKTVDQQIISHELSKLQGMFTPHKFREYIFGSKGCSLLQEYFKVLADNNANVMVTADGFDTMIGYATLDASDPHDAQRFETELLLSLFKLIFNNGPARIGSSAIYDLSKFCIAVPYDRFYDVRMKDRDRYNYRNIIIRSEWSGIELSSLVRKRLSLLRSIKDKKGLPLEDRFDIVMLNGYPELPNELSFQFGSANYKMPLFIYLLRHTFWRPRDLLFYYASLLSASIEYTKKKKPMPTDFVRQIVSCAASTIINDEFIAEFASSFTNLVSIINCFSGAPQVLSVQQVTERIGDEKFETVLYPQAKQTLYWKAKILYDIGFIGVLLDKQTRTMYSAYKHSFSFNEPLVFDKIKECDLQNYKLIIHPVFCEYLHLNTSNNPELILPMDWEYLHENEVIRKLIQLN